MFCKYAIPCEHQPVGRADRMDVGQDLVLDKRVGGLLLKNRLFRVILVLSVTRPNS